MEIYNDQKVDRIIRSLPSSDSSRVVQLELLFEDKGFTLTDTHLKKLTTGLWELRSGKWRLLFGVIGDMAVVVNIFQKKSQKTPKQEIDLALKRLKEYK